MRLGGTGGKDFFYVPSQRAYCADRRSADNNGAIISANVDFKDVLTWSVFSAIFTAQGRDRSPGLCLHSTRDRSCGL